MRHPFGDASFLFLSPGKKGAVARSRFPLPGFSTFLFLATVEKWSQWPGLPDLSRDCEVNMPDFIGKSSQIVLTDLCSF
jgi:hypothetical protein